jgi:protein-tyrosine phosphatase
MAEGMLRARLAALQRTDVSVASAGTFAQTGARPDPLAVLVAAEYGADISTIRARPLEQRDFDEFEYLIAMDLGHLDYLKSTRPCGNTADIRLLLDDVGEVKNIEIPDPYQREREAFEFAGRLIDIGIQHFIKRLLD